MSGLRGEPARLRIAIFGESYLPYLSGVTVATEALARGLGAAGHDVLLAVPRPADPALTGGAGTGGPDPRLAWLPSYQGPPPIPPRYRMPWPVPSAALGRVRSFAPDIVHAQSPFVSGLMARRLARQLGAPLVFTHHTRFGDYRHYLGPLAAPGASVVTAYLRAWWRGCAGVVAPSAELAAEIAAELGRPAATRPTAGSPAGTRPLIRAIPTGLDLDAIGRLVRVDPRPAAGWPPESVVAVSVGRIAREKNVELLLDSFALAAAGDERLRLLLIGDGPLRGELEARVRGAGLADRVAFAGLLPRAQALALAAGADLFVFASQTETQGLVLAEALALGLPVVALAGPGVRDTVRDGVDGTIVVARGAEARAALASAIAALVADRVAREARATAALEGAVRFGLPARIGEMVALYRTLLAADRG